MVTKKKAAASVEPTYAPGDVVIFKGYEDSVPEEERLLEEGERYTLVEVNEEEASLAVEVNNPDFNPKKKESDENSKMVIVDVFFDEVELADEEPEEAPPVKASARGRAKTAPVAVVEDEGEGDETDEAPAPVARGRAKVATAAATAAKPATKAAVKPAAKAKTTAAKVVTKPAAKGKLAAKTKPPVEEDKYPALVEEDADMLAIIDASEDLLELANELVEDAEALNYKLGGVLYHMRLGKAYVSLDKAYAESGGWQKCIEERLPGLGYRKAMNLIDIYYTFNKFGIDAAKVQELGWAKCSRISSVMTEENSDDLVALAEENSLVDLNDSIKESYSKTAVGGEGGTETRKKILFKFRLWQDQAEAVKAVLEDTATRRGLKSVDDAFEHIVLEWAAENAPAQKPPVRKAGNATRPKAVAKA